ncbi:MAG: hypothetical protein ACXWAC_15365 [Usitatibacter sp.]
MSPTRLALVVVAALAVIVIAAGGWFWHATTNFNALVAEMPASDVPGRRERLAEEEARLASSKDDYERWANLPHVALLNAIYGDPARADALADELLAIAPQQRNDWNFGNAIHMAHLAKGHMALKRGDREAARRSLLAAGDTPGSPQLNTFGPNMNLADELLRAGDREVVLAYIEKLGRFWKMDRGALRKWTEMIREGRHPNFAMNLY